MLQLTGTAYKAAYGLACCLAFLTWADAAAFAFGFDKLGITDSTAVNRLVFGGTLLGGVGFFLPRVQAPPTSTRLAAEHMVRNVSKESRK